jgi:hypothetical protein
MSALEEHAGHRERQLAAMPTFSALRCVALRLT